MVKAEPSALECWRTAHARRAAKPGEPICGDRGELRPSVPCDLPLGHGGDVHENEFGFWRAQS